MPSKPYILRANTCYDPTSYTKKTKMNTSPGKFVRIPRNLKQEEIEKPQRLIKSQTFI